MECLGAGALFWALDNNWRGEPLGNQFSAMRFWFVPTILVGAQRESSLMELRPEDQRNITPDDACRHQGSLSNPTVPFGQDAAEQDKTITGNGEIFSPPGCLIMTE